MNKINSSGDRISLITYALDEVFYQSSIQDLRKYYFNDKKDITKWIILSDYYFDDSASNKVITFSMLPNYMDVMELQSQIQQVAPDDIKHVRTVNKKFIELLNSIPVVSFCFIFAQNKYWIWDSKDEMKEWVLGDFDRMKQQIEYWRQTVPTERLDRINRLYKSVSCFERLIKEEKKMKLISPLYFVGLLGGYIGSLLYKESALTTLVWLSDRDSVNEICSNLVRELFQITLINITKQNIQFAFTRANSDSDEWYKELTRIPDYLTGTVSNFNFSGSTITKDKFSQMTQFHLRGNTQNTFLYRFVTDTERIRIKRMLIM